MERLVGNLLPDSVGMSGAATLFDALDALRARGGDEGGFLTGDVDGDWALALQVDPNRDLSRRSQALAAGHSPSNERTPTPIT